MPPSGNPFSFDVLLYFHVGTIHTTLSQQALQPGVSQPASNAECRVVNLCTWSFFQDGLVHDTRNMNSNRKYISWFTISFFTCASRYTGRHDHGVLPALKIGGVHGELVQALQVRACGLGEGCIASCPFILDSERMALCPARVRPYFTLGE